MGETLTEQIERLRTMAEDDGETWDLSDNDKAAIVGVLGLVEELKSALKAMVLCAADGAGKPVCAARLAIAKAEGR
jgi:hypothetical protein